MSEQDLETLVAAQILNDARPGDEQHLGVDEGELVQQSLSSLDISDVQLDDNSTRSHFGDSEESTELSNIDYECVYGSNEFEPVCSVLRIGQMRIMLDCGCTNAFNLDFFHQNDSNNNHHHQRSDSKGKGSSQMSKNTEDESNVIVIDDDDSNDDSNNVDCKEINPQCSSLLSNQNQKNNNNNNHIPESSEMCGYLGKLCEYAKKQQPNGVLLSHIDAVLLTHSDIRHIGALGFAVKKLGLKCPIYSTTPVWRFGQLTLTDALMTALETQSCELIFEELFDVSSIVSIFSELFVKVKFNEELTIHPKKIQQSSSKDTNNHHYYHSGSFSKNSSSSKMSALGSAVALSTRDKRTADASDLLAAGQESGGSLDGIYHGNESDVRVCALPAGHSIGGCIWKITRETEVIVYVNRFNIKRERHLNPSVLGALLHGGGSMMLSGATSLSALTSGSSSTAHSLVKPTLLICDDYHLPLEESTYSLTLQNDSVAAQNACVLASTVTSIGSGISSSSSGHSQSSSSLSSSLKERKTVDQLSTADLLVASVHECLVRGGSALIPSDTGSRSLELLLLLNEYVEKLKVLFGAKNRRSSSKMSSMYSSHHQSGQAAAVLRGLNPSNVSLVFLNRCAESVLETAQSMLEWMNDDCQRLINTNHLLNVFDLRNVVICQSKEEFRQRLMMRASQQRCFVCVCSNEFMQGGFSEDLFSHLYQKPENLVVLTQRLPSSMEDTTQHGSNANALYRALMAQMKRIDDHQQSTSETSETSLDTTGQSTEKLVITAQHKPRILGDFQSAVQSSVVYPGSSVMRAQPPPEWPVNLRLTKSQRMTEEEVSRYKESKQRMIESRKRKRSDMLASDEGRDAFIGGNNRKDGDDAEGEHDDDEEDEDDDEEEDEVDSEDSVYRSRAGGDWFFDSLIKHRRVRMESPWNVKMWFESVTEQSEYGTSIKLNKYRDFEERKRRRMEEREDQVDSGLMGRFSEDAGLMSELAFQFQRGKEQMNDRQMILAEMDSLLPESELSGEGRSDGEKKGLFKRVISEEQQMIVKCRVHFINLEARTDQESLKEIMKRLDAKHTLVIGQNAKMGQSVKIKCDSHYHSVTMDHSLFRKVPTVKIGGYHIGFVSAKMHEVRERSDRSLATHDYRLSEVDSSKQDYDDDLDYRKKDECAHRWSLIGGLSKMDALNSLHKAAIPAQICTAPTKDERSHGGILICGANGRLRLMTDQSTGDTRIEAALTQDYFTIRDSITLQFEPAHSLLLSK